MEQVGSTDTDSSNDGSSPSTVVIVLAVALVIAIIALIAILVWAASSDGADESAAGPDQPESVIAQLNNPLTCNLLEEPRVIGDVTAAYGCQAPGAFLTQVDTSSEPWMAGYFTTNTQTTEVTYGPEEVTVLPNTETP